MLTEAAACPESGGLHRSSTTGVSSVHEVRTSSSFAPWEEEREVGREGEGRGGEGKGDKVEGRGIEKGTEERDGGGRCP